MARIEPLGIHEVDDEIRHLCEESERQSGTSASTRTYARNPAVLKALTTYRATLAREGTIDPVLASPRPPKRRCRRWNSATPSASSRAPNSGHGVSMNSSSA